jgi:hypothetical protein
MQSRPSLGSYARKRTDAGGGPFGKRFNRIGVERLLDCTSRARTYCTRPEREWNARGSTTSVAGTRQLRVPQSSRILIYTRTLGISRIQMLQTGFSAAPTAIRPTWTPTRSCSFKRCIIFSPIVQGGSDRFRHYHRLPTILAPRRQADPVVQIWHSFWPLQSGCLQPVSFGTPDG